MAAGLGLIGLGVMGESLALNAADHGHSVALWNQTAAKAVALAKRADAAGRMHAPATLEEFAAALERPRRILLMIRAGPPVDEMLGRLAPFLARDDVVVDGGNSFFADTERREAALGAQGVFFVGMGVSGGARGARFGPSLMPGGAHAAYERLRPVLESIAARTASGTCVAHVGPGGAGHFAKMVHNGIEYGVMQLIAEIYDLLRRPLGLSSPQAAEVFAEWNHGPMESYLIDVTARVLAVRDPETGLPLVEMILDQAGQKGTGLWTLKSALDLGVPVPTMAAAVDARLMSGLKAERRRASGLLAGGPAAGVASHASGLIQALGGALFAATISVYAQGMSLLRVASLAHRWTVSLREMARIWTGGCIIRARLLESVMRAFDRAAGLENLLLDPDVRGELLAAENAWREAVRLALAHRIPVPALSASLAYFDAYRSAVLPQNLIQAQRDYFGAHGYQRVDRPQADPIHADWDGLRVREVGTESR